MSELIKRMRSYAPLGDGSMWSQPSKDYQLAADEIESLRSKVKELEAKASGTGISWTELQLGKQLKAEQDKVKVLTDALRYSIKQVPELATVPGIAIQALATMEGQ